MNKDLMYRSLDSIGQTGDRLAKSPPEEPDASIAHVRVCEGAGRQRPGLLGRLRYLCILAFFLSGCTNFRPPSLETLSGEWHFAYSQKATLVFTPPSFDIIEFKKDGNIRLHDSLMNREFTGNYSLIGDKLTWTFSPPDMKNPVVHQLECFWTDYGRSLVLRAAKGSEMYSSEEWVYFRPEKFLSRDDISGKWINTIDGKKGDMTFGKDGKYHINRNKIWGYYRLWPSNYGNTLTTVVWIQEEGAFSLFYLYKLEADKLILTPIVSNGPDKKGERVWNRLKSNETPNPMASPNGLKQ